MVAMKTGGEGGFFGREDVGSSILTYLPNCPNCDPPRGGALRRVEMIPSSAAISNNFTAASRRSHV
jgi:hypothetical protein